MKLKMRGREIERKFLEVDTQDIEKRLQNAGAVEVFRGRVTSDYYSVREQEEGLEFLSRVFGLRKEDIIVGSGGAFSRLREMVDDDGTKIYSFETRVREITLGGISTTHADVGDVCSLASYRSLEGLHRDHPALQYREREIKKRLVCILPGFVGLEYALDEILQPETVSPYLEIEVSGSDPSFELLLEGVRKLGLDETKLARTSARKLIGDGRARRSGGVEVVKLH